MEKIFKKILKGYQLFREKYVLDDQSIMQPLSYHGQKPEVMVIACCDSRVDPALILQCDPGDLFVVRNVANSVPPYEKDSAYHGTSAALEFGICYLGIKHLILLGHSQCGGIEALLKPTNNKENDFINNWVSIIKKHDHKLHHVNYHTIDSYTKLALQQSQYNCMTFPWIKDMVLNTKLTIHLWFFDIKTGQIFTYYKQENSYKPLEHLDFRLHQT